VTVACGVTDRRCIEGVADEPADLIGPIRDRFGLALGGNSLVETADECVLADAATVATPGGSGSEPATRLSAGGSRAPPRGQ
jgi:hypothetical protein